MKKWKRNDKANEHLMSMSLNETKPGMKHMLTDNELTQAQISWERYETKRSYSENKLKQEHVLNVNETEMSIDKSKTE